MKDTTIAENFYVIRQFLIHQSTVISSLGGCVEQVMRVVAAVSAVPEKERAKLRDCAELLRSGLTVYEDGVNKLKASLPV